MRYLISLHAVGSRQLDAMEVALPEWVRSLRRLLLLLPPPPTWGSSYFRQRVVGGGAVERTGASVTYQ
ncbi:hypothetical protein chiPu_0008939 [Chiloscyllium punctatum]|uniref:Uncharacterized protein n=1 Tax=Chiloscyllium punctatum TaxID=137246 RepID=A0A401SJB6_CHIPU|nr:hypothetical protein [Chiloscyllium punctatum]